MKRKATLRELFNIQGGLCAYCERPMDITRCNTANAPTIEHLLPVSKYPELAKDIFNMVCACRECNNKKADMPLVVFIGRQRKAMIG